MSFDSEKNIHPEAPGEHHGAPSFYQNAPSIRRDTALSRQHLIVGLTLHQHHCDRKTSFIGDGHEHAVNASASKDVRHSAIHGYIRCAGIMMQELNPSRIVARNLHKKRDGFRRGLLRRKHPRIGLGWLAMAPGPCTLTLRERMHLVRTARLIAQETSNLRNLHHIHANAQNHTLPLFRYKETTRICLVSARLHHALPSRPSGDAPKPPSSTGSFRYRRHTFAHWLSNFDTIIKGSSGFLVGSTG